MVKVRRIALAAAAMVLMGGALVAGPSTASAAEVWHQSVGRASADAPCPKSTDTELAAGWTQWGPSWSQWANKGTGGYTCNRQITWAFSGPAKLCVEVFSGFYADFSSSNVLPVGSLLYGAGCTPPEIFASFTITVYAGSAPEAQALCPVGQPATLAGGDPNVYFCNAI